MKDKKGQTIRKLFKIVPRFKELFLKVFHLVSQRNIKYLVK